jgi:trans-aconitate methyltransferase
MTKGVAIKGEAYYRSPQRAGIDRRTKALVVERCLPFFRGQKILDLGFVDGCWTDPVLERGWSSDIVEGDRGRADDARTKYCGEKRVRVFQAMFTEFTPDQSYDTIIAGDILRYIADPVPFLARLRTWLATNGILIVTAPNGLSMHRRVGALMGMEDHPMDANRRDIEVGNLRSYDRYRLRAEILEAGLSLTALHGCFLKPLSSDQIADWDDRMLRAFLQIGDELEDYAWFLYAVCTR